jgi:uncharacterized repeat protein (TIGR03803 family)
MKSFRFYRYTLGVCMAVLLTGCGGSQPPLSSSSAGLAAGRSHVRPAYAVLHAFDAYDGANPEASLIDVKGTLYGTTYGGGDNYYGDGTVFAITTSGTETLLHSFGNASGKDGAYPAAGLIDVNGTLYGTTVHGGAYASLSRLGNGTVFAISTLGREKMLYSFGGSDDDGSEPYAGLINVKGVFYGTTLQGGAKGHGTVFALEKSGKESVLHSFGDKHDGEYPYAGLLNLKAALYGTTSSGGAKGCQGDGCGTVFAIATSGTESVLHGFNWHDGAYPEAGLLNVKGTLYGTTYRGGATGDGDVFAITTSGKETVLHRFGGLGDGSDPVATLVNINGTFYGTTRLGGANGDGTVFAITSSGKESVLHNFAGGSGDGADPRAGLINVNGTLYGTTSGGGPNGVGTVFSLTP